MKAINTGDMFRIYSDNLKVYDELPAGSYIVRFDQMQGFYLEQYSDIEINEDKIYGIHLNKAEKCLKAFEKTNRNLGVILSGAKGIGKSLFAKLLSKTSIEKGYALIVVDKFIPGIASFIEEIEQEVVVLFDEFDKTFGQISVSDNEVKPQSTLLTLFDGISAGKKLYIVTCNDLYSLNDYLVNRPGRFHYHFRFEYPEGNEIKEYLQDKLEKQYWDEIQKVVAFSRKINLNYDCLRSIAFEIQNGETFESAIKDLNIVNTESSKYKLILHFTDGTTMSNRSYSMDMFNEDRDNEFCWLQDSKGNDPVGVDFFPLDAEYDMRSGCSIISADKFTLSYDKDESDDIESIKSLKPKFLAIHRKYERNIHYAV